MPYDLNYRPSLWDAAAAYPNFKVIGTTMRTVRTVRTGNINNSGAIAWSRPPGSFGDAP